MKIVFAASECVPFAKTGGLADVVGALGPELVKLGHEVTVYLPLYARVRPHIQGELKYAVRSLTIPFQYYNRFAGIVDGGTRDGVKYYFVDCPELFNRSELYGARSGDYPDNAERFGLYCRAVLEATKQLGVLLASGLIVGESIVGVVIAAIVAFADKLGFADREAPLSLVGPGFAGAALVIGGLAFAAVVAVMYRWVWRMAQRGAA